MSDKIAEFNTEAVSVVQKFAQDFIPKYINGGIEHGGDFFSKPVVNEVRAEVLDLVAYTESLIRKKIELQELVATLAPLSKRQDEDFQKLLAMVNNL